MRGAQRWVLVFSEPMYARQVKTCRGAGRKQLKEPMQRPITCRQRHQGEPDALAAAELAAKWPLLKAMEPEVSTKTVNKPERRGGPGRGRAGCLLCQPCIRKGSPALEDACKGLGKFMLATHDLALGDEQILQAYKQQGTVERGFRFLKNGDFQLAPSFSSHQTHTGPELCHVPFPHGVFDHRKPAEDSLAKANETIRIQDNGPADYKNNAGPP